MTREIIQPGYGYFFSVDEKTKEIMRIYYIEGTSYPKLVNSKGHYVPATKMTQTRYEKMMDEDVLTRYVVDDDGNYIPVIFPPPYKHQNWFEKIDDKYFNDEVIDEVEAYNIFIGLIAGIVFKYSPEPTTKGVAGVIYAGTEAVTALYAVKKGINHLKNKKDPKAIELARQMERNVRLYERLKRNLKKIGDTPLDDQQPFQKDDPIYIEDDYLRYYY